MHLSLCWVLLLCVLDPQTVENAGTKVVIRNTFAGHSSDNTTYSMADRKRTEFRRAAQRTKEDGSVEWDETTIVLIVRCDLGQSFSLNMKAEEYSVAEYPPKPLTPGEMAAHGLDTAIAPHPTLRIEMTTVDTGEREKMFGHVARHVITTTKQIPLEGSHTQPQETVRDGWYIDDVDRRISCDPKPPAGSVSHGFLTIVAAGGGKGTMMERPEFVDIGARETGFPVKEMRTTTSETVPATGVRRYSDFVNESEVTQFEAGPLDPTLFEVPPGFKHVERSQP